VERDIDELTTLLDKPKVNTVLFDLPFLFFHKFLTPNGRVLDVHIINEMIVQVNRILFVVFLHKFILSVS
jgi:hypothetical protein